MVAQALRIRRPRELLGQDMEWLELIDGVVLLVMGVVLLGVLVYVWSRRW